MKRVVFLIPIFILFSFFNAVHAATPIDGMYTGAFAGYIYVPSNIDQGYNAYTLNAVRYQGGYEAGGNFGYKSNPMRYEAEVTYLRAQLDHFSLDQIVQSTQPSGYNQALFGMANIYFDWPLMNPILQPFVGAGIGYGWVQAKISAMGPTTTTAFSGINSSFAYQAMAGVTFNFAENYALTLNYRYIGTSELAAFNQMFQVHMANVGVTYRFDEAKYR